MYHSTGKVASADGRHYGEFAVLEATPRWTGRGDQRNAPMPRCGAGPYVIVTTSHGVLKDYCRYGSELAAYGLPADLAAYVKITEGDEAA